MWQKMLQVGSGGSGKKTKNGNVTLNTTNTTPISLGFRPSIIVGISNGGTDGTYPVVIDYYLGGKVTRVVAASTSSGYTTQYDVSSYANNCIREITNDGFVVNPCSSGRQNYTYIAIE